MRPAEPAAQASAADGNPPASARWRALCGWAAVALSTALGSIWGFWGILENFHEGWYHATLWTNVAMLFGQYLAPMLAFVAAAACGIYWPRVGGLLHVGGAGCALWFFRGAALRVLLPTIAGPLVVLAALWWLGRPRPRRLAVALVAGIPLAVVIACGVEPAYRVATRFDDGDLSARAIAGNGMDLVWAPQGPGWPTMGVSWDEARRRCRHLTEDGRSLAERPQDVWRLPTVEELVRTATRHGRNCDGVWDAQSAKARYATLPDKESPLWNLHSQVIYWWTATEVDEDRAYIFVYNGQVWPRPKSAHWGYLGFRAVKNPPPHDAPPCAP